MTVSAHDVAAALRERLPGLPVKKQHKLLYLSQGHHLASFGVPLFAETISAWDMGPVVGQLWQREKAGDCPLLTAELDEAQLNTIGYVVSRYGALTGKDLELLTHGQDPWKIANATRRPTESVRIEIEWIERYFRDVADAGDDEPARLDSGEVHRWLNGATPPAGDVEPDTVEAIMARLAASA